MNSQQKNAIKNAMRAASNRLKVPTTDPSEQAALAAEITRQLTGAKEAFVVASAAACKLGNYIMAEAVDELRREVAALLVDLRRDTGNRTDDHTRN